MADSCDDLGTRLGAAANALVIVVTLVLLGTSLVVFPEEASLSEAEKRALAPPPRLAEETLFDGTFMTAAEAFIADHFPFRDRFLAASFRLRSLRGIEADGFTMYDVEVNEGGPAEVSEEAGGGLAGGEEDPEPTGGPDPEDLIAPDEAGDLEGPLLAAVGGEAAGSTEVAATAGAEGGARAATKPAVAGEDASARRLTVNRGILISRGRAMEAFGGGPRGSRGWAESVNAYPDALGPSVEIWAILVPSPSAFYVPEEYSRHSRPQGPNIEATYALLRPEVHRVDAFEEIAAHVGDYVYFRTDHHWTGLGAYFAYRAFCKAAKLEPVPLEAMTVRTQPKFLGSLYWLTRDPRLARDPDRVEWYVPPVRAEVFRLHSSGRGKGTAHRLFAEGAYGYGVFLGGDHAVLVARTPLANGRRVVLVKNSYGNAFAPLLVSHFEEVVVVDYRYFTGSLVDLVRERGITDVIVLNGVFSANTGYHVKRIKRILRPPPAVTRPDAPPPAQATGG